MSGQLVIPKKEKREIKLEKLKPEIVEFLDLDENTRWRVVKDYAKAWEAPLTEEKKLGIIKLPFEEEIWNQFHSEPYTKHFRRGQMVLMAKIEGQWEPIRSIRSVIWRILERETIKPCDWEGTEYGEHWHPEDQMDDIRIGKCPECYPDTWYKASNNGYGHVNIKMMENGEIRDYQGTDYERIQNSSKEENREHKLVLINYAVQSGGNVPDDIKISGATRAIISERGEFAEKSGLGCDTYTPMNGFARWVSKLQISESYFEEFEKPIVLRYIDEKMLSVIAKGIKSDIPDAGTMHLWLGANFVGWVKDARYDPRSKNYCVITSYSP